MTDWLPSERAWIDQLAERVLSGEILLVRCLPRWGLSTVCRSIAEVFGESAVVVNGRTMTESNQKVMREQIDADVTAAIDKTGCAQLIFDDYGRAIRRSQGGTLHSILYRLLIDSGAARDTGALLIARSGDSLDLNFSGSPLVSRAQAVALPVIEAEDASALGTDLVDLKKLAGESTWLARRFLNASPRQGNVNAVEHLNSDRRRIIQAMPPAAVEVLAGARALADADLASREALLCFGSINEDGEFEPSALMSESALPDEVRFQNPGWPGALAESVQRFADLLAGAQDAIWVDRYLFSEPSRVRAFLVLLRQLTATRLRLLTSDDRDRSGFAHDISSAMDGLDGVSIRFMDRHDRRRLHDRHLVLHALKSGFVLPTAGVILGADDPGSAVSAPIAALAVDYAECWGRGAQVFPSI